MGFWLLVLGLRFGVMVGRVLCFCVDVDVDVVSFHAPGQNAIISNEIILSDPTQRRAGHCELFNGFLQISLLNQIYCKFH